MMPSRKSDASHPDETPRRGPAAPLLAVALILGAGGCVLTEPSIEPYRSDPAAAARLEARATHDCRALRALDGRAPEPLRPFRTDGCSAWPDSEATQPCCVEHDIAYWCGGSRALRLAADDAFGECVRDRSQSAALGAWMRAGVRVGGHPFFPMPYRWGYGDAYSGRYPRTTADGP